MEVNKQFVSGYLSEWLQEIEVTLRAAEVIVLHSGQSHCNLQGRAGQGRAGQGRAGQNRAGSEA